ncbi:MAG: PorP/SprF family type IX secretion system membrane protein [Bacteroidetes bacterium]|jgi:type IX secretion system PorP/SprF family membrane protein|nr:PorP/SprF family type IX secretion system membrane protein [Bacteroidota bacterium]
MMSKLKNISLLLLGLALSMPVFAQTDMLFSQHGMNQRVFNPAAIIDNGMLNMELMGRQQWIGFPDAPSVQYVGADLFMEQQPMGLKFGFLNQIAGKEITRQLGVSYAYQVRFSQVLSAQFGLSAGFYQRQVRFSELIFEEGNEPLIKPDESVLKPDFSFGFELYWKAFTLGMAANHVTTPHRKATIFKIPIHNHFYLMHRFILENEIQFFSGISWHQQGSINRFQLDVQFNFGQWEAGLAYRNQDALILKAGIALSANIRMNYAYDFGISKIANYNSGTHEISLQFNFARRSGTYLSPRFLD